MSELFKRSAPGLALAGLALSTVWLFDPALHAQPEATAAAGGAEAEAGESESADAGTPDSGSGSTEAETGSTDSDTGSTDSDAGSTDSESTDTGTDSADSSTGSGDSESSTSSTDCSTADSVTGDSVMTRWGPVQVQMSFAADGSVCSVEAIAYPVNDPKSAHINAMAIPWLDQQAAEVGTAFDSVSGATYTSEAYRASMQSILDQR